MSQNLHRPTELNLLSLLDKESKYIIPIYQRNFAWGKKEIEQLLQDIIDKSEDNNSKYYVGTLIVDEKRNGLFEIIDGQQRHTTLTLVNAFLNPGNKQASNLNYEARPEVEKYLDSLFTQSDKIYETTDESVNKIKEGFDIINSFWSSGKDLRDREFSKDRFLKYFYENVIIIRVNVPKDTDINHYFEVMNTRGVQLEKHQILKSAFISSIYKNESYNEIEKLNLSTLFGKIWDACANMYKYIQYGFEGSMRKKIFGMSLNDLPKEINAIQLGESTTAAQHPERTLYNILSGKIQKNEKVNNSDDNNFIEGGKYYSIIDFPNFLLQVLRLHSKDATVSLDDKTLLNSFGYHEKKLPDPIEFINDLLRYRVLFDRYFIKRQIDNDNDYKWVILQPSENENDYLINTFGEDGVKLIMIQSMFQVSFPTNSYKNWLNHLLKWISDNSAKVHIDEFIQTTLCLAEKFYNERSTNGNWEYGGVGINNYIFNYLDYLIWSIYFQNIKGEREISGDGSLLSRISKSRKWFENFRFTQRSSVEHVFPQNHWKDLNSSSDEDRKKTLNAIGNLCLISKSSNSKYSDLYPAAKKDHFEKLFAKNMRVESLKQALIFSYDVWDTPQIKQHTKEMLSLLNGNDMDLTLTSPNDKNKITESLSNKVDGVMEKSKENIENKLAQASEYLKLQLGNDYSVEDNFGAMYSGITYNHPNWKNYTIRFEFNENRKDFFYGICLRPGLQKDRNAAKKIEICLDNSEPDKNESWPYFRWFELRNWEEIFKEIPNEEFAGKIRHVVTHILEQTTSLEL